MAMNELQQIQGHQLDSNTGPSVCFTPLEAVLVQYGVVPPKVFNIDQLLSALMATVEKSKSAKR